MTRALLFAVAFAMVFGIAASAIPSPAQIITRADRADSIVIPAGSTLRFQQFDRDGTAKFAGSAVLSGTYYYGANAMEDGTAGEPTVYFVPDETTKARLPYFRERGAPAEIYISNPKAFVKAAIPRQRVAGFVANRTKYLSGKIDIRVDQFEAGIECDAPFFNARFAALAHPPLKVALADLPDAGC